MIITKSNYLNGSNPFYSPTITVNPVSPDQDINVIANDDFSSVFTSTINLNTISIDLGTTAPISYIAIGGSTLTNFAGVTVKADSVTIFNETYLDNESKTIFIVVDITADVIEIEVNDIGESNLAIANVAIGEYYTVPRGEQSGYNRPWTVTNIKNRNAVNLQNAPISMTHESRALSCTLTVPNNLIADFASWYEMISFVTQNNFYILEDDDATHSYACFNAMPPMTKAHGQTRKLGVSALKFSAFSKSNEIFL